MSGWTDLFTVLPLPEPWLRALLFITFGLHLLFVLLVLGTITLGLGFSLYDRIRGGTAERNTETRLGLRTLAVVLGVAPLLIIQVRYPHAFFTATGLFSYAWLALIPLLIGSFLLLDGLGHTERGRSFWPILVVGLVSLGALLTVPAVFTGVLSLMERQEAWQAFAEHGPNLKAGYLPHWVLRYLHVLGAALVLGAAFMLVLAAGKRADTAPRLRLWLTGAILAQVIIGIPLVFTVARGMNWPVALVVTAGAAAAMAVFWILRSGAVVLGVGVPRSLIVLVPCIFVAMLAARQLLQDGAVTPGEALALANREERAERLGPFQQQALEAFSVKLATVYDNGETIYDGACVACHGTGGRGDGPAARDLVVPAEDLAAVRADRDYVYGLLLEGVPGSSMPYFRLYDRLKLDSLLDTLGARFSMFEAAADGRATGSAAATVWAETCAVCHGAAGEQTAFGRTLLPPPPDLRRYSLTRERALEVITNGYPGTVMQPFRALPQDIREDLAVLSASFRPARRPEVSAALPAVFPVRSAEDATAARHAGVLP